MKVFPIEESCISYRWDFKLDTLFNSKPMKRSENRNDVTKFKNFRDSSSCIEFRCVEDDHVETEEGSK